MEPGTRPLVVDPFAGSGSIPLEALRVGADAFASDLNPVAVLLNMVVLEYIPKYGQWIVHTSIPDQPGEQSGNDGSHTDLWKQPAGGGGKAEKLCRFPARIHDLCWAGARSPRLIRTSSHFRTKRYMFRSSLTAINQSRCARKQLMNSPSRRTSVRGLQVSSRFSGMRQAGDERSQSRE